LIPHLVPPYKNILKGRFGNNRGVEILGYQDYRDAIIVHDFAKEAESVLGKPALLKLIKTCSKKSYGVNVDDVIKSDFYQLVKDNKGLVNTLKRALFMDDLPFFKGVSKNKLDELKQDLEVAKIDETKGQYTKRTDYNKNVSELLELGKNSKTWTAEDIKILAYDSTAVNDIRSALLFEQGKALPITSKIKSRDQFILENTIKLVSPEKIIGQLTGSKKLREKDNGAVEMIKFFFKDPAAEIWRRTVIWMQDFPEHITSSITEQKETYLKKIEEFKPEYRKAILEKFQDLIPEHMIPKKGLVGTYADLVKHEQYKASQFIKQ
jgi:hypothetical protein